MRSYTPADTRPAWEPRPYTQGQADLIKLMMSERDITAEQLFAVFPQRPTTFQDGSKVINWLKGQTKTVKDQAAAQPTSTASPQGALPVRLDKHGKHLPQYYAVEMDGKPHFFKIKPGRNRGMYFVDEQASDDFFPVRGARKDRVMTLVLADVAKAQALYGQLIGRCSRCRKVLTDHTNPYFEMGLGPECGDK